MSVRVEASEDEASFRLTGDEPDIDCVNVFLRTTELRGLSPRTARAYAHDSVILLRWLSDCGKRLLELTDADLLEFVAWQRDVTAKPRSINRRLTSTRQLLTSARRAAGLAPLVSGAGRGRPRRDFSMGLQTIRQTLPSAMRVKVPQTLVEPLTKTQTKAFLRRLKRYRDISIVYLMLLCGLRSREVRELRLGDIDFESHRLRVRGKGNKERTVPLPSTLMMVLRRYLELERPTHCQSEHCFTVLQGPGRGKPMNAEALRMIFRHRRREKLIASANPHRFRHTFGTDMARARVRLPVLQKMMGHVHADTTMQYVNLSVEDVVEEYERVIAKIMSRYEGDK